MGLISNTLLVLYLKIEHCFLTCIERLLLWLPVKICVGKHKYFCSQDKHLWQGYFNLTERKL